MAVEVWIDENGPHGDEEGRYRHGEYESVEAAIAECRRIVDDFLESQRSHDISTEELFRIYSLFGDDPYLVGAERAEFSGLDYARRRCEELCALD